MSLEMKGTGESDEWLDQFSIFNFQFCIFHSIIQGLIYSKLW